MNATTEAVRADETPKSTSPNMSMGILGAISATHMINDTMQSVLIALYPVFRHAFTLSFAQIGFITVAFQVSASLLQPLIGRVTDKHPLPYSLPVGMTSTFAGLITLAFAPSYGFILLASVLIGMGSSVFHPESSRVARMASAGQHGFAQSIFQVGGMIGASIGPLLAASFIVPRGQHSAAWVAVIALLGIVILLRVSRWYSERLNSRDGQKSLHAAKALVSPKGVYIALTVLVTLMFSKFFYLAALRNYFTFYLEDHFGLSVQASQYGLFVFLFASALGTIAGGPIGDRIGRKRVIWGSILGSAPFALVLPFANLPWTIVLSFVIGFVISSAFPAIVVYGQELMPGKTGAVSGLFFGLAFGIGGLGAAALGALADAKSIEFVYGVTAFLPLIGIVAWLLPDIREPKDLLETSKDS